MNKLIAVAILLSASVATAESLEERKYWKGQQSYLDASLKKGEKTCGVAFTHEFLDKEKFRAEAEKTKHSPYSICKAMVDRVLSLCREGEDEKTTVAEKIKGFKCGFGNPRTLDIKDGTLTYMGNHVQSNFDQWAKPALTKKL